MDMLQSQARYSGNPSVLPTDVYLYLSPYFIYLSIYLGQIEIHFKELVNAIGGLANPKPGGYTKQLDTQGRADVVTGV